MTCGLAVNVRDYGAVGDSITDDSAAFQAAIDAALAEPKVVFVPPGSYLVPATLTIPGSLAFRGAGRGFTTIIHPGAANGFTVTAPNGSTVEFEDFTLQGPTGLGFDSQTKGIYFAVNWTFLTRFSVRRVNVLGTFEMAVERGGGGIFEIDDCHLEATDGVVGAYESTNTADSMTVTVRNSTLTTPSGDLSSQGSVGFYVHPHVSYLVEGCRFQTLGRYGVYENGSPTAKRRPSSIVGCQFADAEMLRGTANGKTTVSGCTLKGTLSGLGSGLWGADTNITGCTFHRGGPLVTNGSARFVGCVFVDTKVGISTGGTLLEVRDCLFRITDTDLPSDGLCVEMSGATAHRSIISGCEFEDTSTAGTSSPAVYASGAAHDARISGCRFRGVRATNGGGMLRHRGARLHLEGCEFDNTAQGTTKAVSASIRAGMLEGGGNVFRGTTQLASLDGTTQQRLTRRPGVNPTPVPSALSIDTNTAPWLSYDTHVVTGTAIIATLSNPWVSVGEVRLAVADGAAWSTADTGNIVPRVLSARTPGAVVTLLWEPTTAKWLEV